MTYVIYGSCQFTNQSRRNSVATTITNWTNSHGFTPFAFAGNPAGVVNVGTTGITISFSHEDLSEIEQAEGIANQALQLNQYSGSFGWQLL